MKKIISCLLVFVLFCGLTACGDSGVYKKAQTALKNEDYEQVIELLDSIPDHDDSDNLRDSANEGISAGIYEKAKTILDQGEYEQVIELLDSIPDYGDADGLRKSADIGILNDIVDASAAPECCEVASDGSYIKIDTNPNDTKKFYSAEYMQTVQDINKALGFPESLYEKMLQTRALDGRLTDENDTFSVSWSYHPDKGMSALYERK